MDKEQLDTQLTFQLLKRARENLSAGMWDYLVGGAESETTLKRNRLSFETMAFRPRVLNDVWDIDCTKMHLGVRQRIPVFTAPVGNLQDIHPDGCAAVARACGDFGVMSMHSIVSTPSLEETAAAHAGPKAYQLYILGDRDWLDEWLGRVIKAGYQAVAITVDLDRYGHRERDLSKGFLSTSQKQRVTIEHIARFNWNDVRYIKENYDIPLIIKGIATAEDAEQCCDYGVDVVYVSNHGGRQLDHGRGTLELLSEVVPAVKGRAEVVADGGIMRGTDVVKAIALGANSVGIGKLLGIAMGAAGQDGVHRVLEILEREITTCLALLGLTSFEGLDASYLQPSQPVATPGLTSSFSLLDEGY